jgi:predicted dehydrogenase
VDTEKIIRVGIIGTGQIGKRHVAKYREIAGAKVVAIADINTVEAERVARQYDIPNVYDDFRHLLEREDLEAVDVCLHNNLHMPITVAALEAGKHVFCEKPMAGSYVDAVKMAQAAQRCQRKLSIQLSYLFTKEVKAAKFLIDEGYLGRLYHARSTGFRRRGRPYVDGYGSSAFVLKEVAGGGVLYDMGVYQIAAILFLLSNPEVIRVSGKTYQEIPMPASRQKASGYNVEELALGFVRFSNDITLDIIESWAIHLDRFEGSYVVGNQGGVRLQPFGFFHQAGFLDLDSTADLDIFEFRLHTVDEQGDAYDSPQHHWIAALQGRVSLLPTVDIALNTMIISEGIYLSSKLDREVTVEEIMDSSSLS